LSDYLVSIWSREEARAGTGYSMFAERHPLDCSTLHNLHIGALMPINLIVILIQGISRRQNGGPGTPSTDVGSWLLFPVPAMSMARLE
jgi:hypothetical protein